MSTPRTGRRATNRRRPWLLSLATAAAVLVGANAYAYWSADTDLSATLTGGYVHFAVDDDAIDEPGDTVTWEVPEFDSDYLTERQHYEVIEVEAASQGNRGLRFSLTGASLDPENAALLRHGTLTLFEVDAPGACTAGAEVDDPLYSGPFADATTEAITAVAWDDTTSTTDAPATTYLCVGFSHDLETTHTNVGTVRATPDGGGPEVTDSDEWHATIAIDDAVLSPTASLTFSYATFRPPGGAG